MCKVYVDDETVDRIVVSAMKLNMEIAKKAIDDLKSRKKLASHNKEDLADYLRSYDAMKVVYDYFGGNIK